MEIFQCEINPLLEKFFEAPEPKEPSTSGGANQDMAMTGADDDGEVLTDDLGAAVSDDKDNDLDFDNVFTTKTGDKKVENTFSFDTPAEDKKEDAASSESKEEEKSGSAESGATDEESKAAATDETSTD